MLHLFVAQTTSGSYFAQTTGLACLQALHTLAACLHSETISAMSSVHQLRDQILALVFQLSWSAVRTIKLADSYVRLLHDDDASSEESSEANSEADVTTAGIDAAAGSFDSKVQCPHHTLSATAAHML